MRLLVCPAASLRGVYADAAPSHIVSFRSPGRPRPDLPSGIARIDLVLNDIAEPRPDLVSPDAGAVAELLSFGRTWSGPAPLLVSCEFGVSRSTAAAFALACQAWAHEAEAAIAHRLRRASPSATPNRLIVSLADRILGRQDRMTAAVAALGRGVDYLPYRSFELAPVSPALSAVPG